MLEVGLGLVTGSLRRMRVVPGRKEMVAFSTLFIAWIFGKQQFSEVLDQHFSKNLDPKTFEM